MKLDYLEILHVEFEVCSFNSMAVREIIRLDQKQIRKIRKTRRLDHQTIRRLEIMKLDYLEMLHAKFEVSSLNSMAVREIIRLDQKQIRKIRNTKRLDHQTIRRLEIMKLDYLEMLHDDFEVSCLNSMAVREIIARLEADQKYQKNQKIRSLDHQKTRDYESRLSRDAVYRI